MSMGHTHRSLVLSLYRQLLKESAKLPSYNFREYALRRARDAFRANATVTDSTRINSLIEEARANLEVVRRQAIIGQLYPSQKLVVESNKKL